MAAQSKTTAPANGCGAAPDRPESPPLDEDLEALWRLRPDLVRRRWRSLVGRRPMPTGLGRGLTLRIIGYYAQVREHGGLDRASQRVLAETLDQARQATSAALLAEGHSQRPDARGRGPDLLRPGTVLARDYAGTLHKVMVLDDGFGWNGQVFDSLSKVALAITGTRWNGPRFFGLRDKPAATKEKTASRTDEAREVKGRGRVSGRGRASSSEAAP